MARKDWRNGASDPNKASLRPRKKTEQRVKNILRSIDLDDDDVLFEDSTLKKNSDPREKQK